MSTVWTHIGSDTEQLIVTFLGVLAAFWLATRHERRAAEGKRYALFKQLRIELEAVSDHFPDFDPHGSVAADTIQLGTPSLLLDGDPRNLEKGDYLLEWLVNLQVAVSVYNDFAQQYFSAQVAGAPEELLRKMHDVLTQRHERVVGLRDGLLRKLL